ncbi:hypothetical protein BJY01DRAFT_249263 [Aspergillus pseudoustus]|uniref:NAD(P)-binding protein n=1 Tax=Aspergillus pseudoustus TaxID=1810923 RepID=A0ABR4JQF7_9EURO
MADKESIVTRKNFTTQYRHDTYPRLQGRLANSTVSGKSVFLTGAGKGIGVAIALAFARAGPRVIFLCGRTRSTLEETRARIQSASPTVKAEVIVVDIGKGIKSVLDAFSEARELDLNRPVDILVNNAAYLAAELVVSENPDDDERVFDANWNHYAVNVRGSLALATAFLRNSTAIGPTIINISSGAAVLDHVPLIGCYSSSKLATLKMYSDLSYEQAHRGLAIFHLHPGSVQTSMSAPGANSADTGMYNWLLPQTAQGPRIANHVARESTSAQLSADFAVWLTSSEAQFLHNRLIYANWDVDELLAKKETILAGDYLKLGVTGWNSTAY